MKSSKQQQDLQHAWQTAFHLRMCPDNETLRMVCPSENLKQHLSICSQCRENRAMPPEQTEAWGEIFNKFSGEVQLTQNKPEPGQVWAIKKTLGQWSEDGYFYSPPNILILEKLDDKNGFRVAQIYFDKRLMDDGDVWLSDQFGFAQGWNIYTIHRKVLDCWLGDLDRQRINAVIKIEGLCQPPLEEYSILSFFRKLEITVGAYVSVPSVAALVEECEASPSVISALDYCKRYFSIETLEKALSGWELPEVFEDVFQLAASALAPSDIVPLTASGELEFKQVNHVQKQGEDVLVKPVLIEVCYAEWQGDGYMFTGKLTEKFMFPVEVLATLRNVDLVQTESQTFTVVPGALEFELFFENSCEDYNDLQILLVSHAQA